MTRTPIATRAQLRIAGPIFRSGLWTSLPHASRQAVALTQDRLYFSPWPVSRAITVSQLGVETTVAGATGAVMRFGIYTDNGGAPDALLLDAGTTAVDGAIGLKTLTGLTYALLPDLYWLASVPQVATPPTLRCINLPLVNIPVSSFLGSAPSNQLIQSGITGALPATATSSATSANGSPLVAVMPA